ncbi:MAG TPA: hypothetical protein VMP89_10330, partial [Solirubrobacteraceae bacterium]|nr:hypothetical protein [Solirubrobacteraceae bacterium]
AQQVLGLAFDGSAPMLLTGSAPTGASCCSGVGVTRFDGGSFGARRALISGLTGATLGSLTAVSPGRLLASVATDRGVWVAQSRPGGPFAATHRLTGFAQMPWTLATTALGGAGALAWTATTGQQGEIAPGQIFTASGSASRAPGGARVTATVPAGHQVDELSLTPGRGRPTLAWVENWIAANGAYGSQVVLRDLGAVSAPRVIGAAGETASGLTAAGDPRGDQVVAWRDCDPTPACRLWAVYRRGGGRFGAPVALGAIDPYEDPAAAVSSGGEALVGWIAGGRVIAAARSPSASRFGAAHAVSTAADAGELALAFSPGGQALVTWTAWSATTQLLGALLG